MTRCTSTHGLCVPAAATTCTLPSRSHSATQNEKLDLDLKTWQPRPLGPFPDAPGPQISLLVVSKEHRPLGRCICTSLCMDMRPNRMRQMKEKEKEKSKGSVRHVTCCSQWLSFVIIVLGGCENLGWSLVGFENAWIQVCGT
jgi:hypothetical protein